MGIFQWGVYIGYGMAFGIGNVMSDEVSYRWVFVVFGLPGLLRAAGCRVPAHPWHTLRHTFASHFIMAGGNILTLQKILGHSDVKMTMIYAHLAPDYLGQEMERVSFVRGSGEG